LRRAVCGSRSFYLFFFLISCEQAVEFAEFNAVYLASDSNRVENSTVRGTVEWGRVVCSLWDRETGYAEEESVINPEEPHLSSKDSRS
jgi:hypothetical protein